MPVTCSILRNAMQHKLDFLMDSQLKQHLEISYDILYRQLESIKVTCDGTIKFKLDLGRGGHKIWGPLRAALV